MELKFVAHTYPTPAFPFYGTRVAVSGIAADTTVVRCEVNGEWMRDVWVFNDAEQCRKGILRLDAGYNELRIRTDARVGETPHIHLEFSDGAVCELDTPAVEGNDGWFMPDWKYCAAVILSSPNGNDRKNEPVHQPLAVYLDRIADPVKEVRVVEICEAAGCAHEIPSQVYHVSKWDAFADEHCQPTMNFDVAFLANVKADKNAVYLVFYGNPNAEKPVYETDLKVTGDGLVREIENVFYKVKLHPLSGGIDEVTVKQGVNQTFAHHLETNGSMDWNPDCYAPPTPWNHISDWDPPAHYEWEVGPVFATLKRWGTMPMYDDVKCSVSYTFYAKSRPIVVSSTMELTQDKDVVALRSGEVVMNRELCQEVAWRNMDGTVTTSYITDLPRHPTRGQYLPSTTPWVAIYNREKEACLGISYMEFGALRMDTGLERVDSHIYVHIGPWIYVARPLLYTFVGNNPQRVMHAYGNTIHYEKMAWNPMRIHYYDESAFDELEDTTENLRLPLQRRVEMDTDPRVPTEWVPPILLAEFDEL